MEGVNLRYTVSTDVNITTYPPVQRLYANQILKRKKETSSLEVNRQHVNLLGGNEGP
jgi:hypothetical protein